MEFINANYFDTTTQLTISSGTLTASYLLSRDLTRQYSTDGFNNDLTTASITFTFDSTQTVSRIALMEMNLKSFTIFYNGSTANTFSFTTAHTTTSDFSTNSETSMYFTCSTIQCSSITIDMKTTQTANAEKAIGYAVFSDLKLDFDKLPDSKGYKPMVNSKEVVHKLADGRERVNVIDRKYGADLSLKNITETFRDSLWTVYKSRADMMFCAFGTSTGWDQIFFPCAWQGSFDFYMYANNNPSAGYDGKIKLRES